MGVATGRPKNAPPIPKYCGCKDGLAAAYQDIRYGKGMRLHNPGKDTGYKCTCCGVRR